MRWVYIVLEKILIITIDMTTIGRRVDDEMRRRRNDDKTEGTAQPAGRIRRRGHCVVGPIDVGHEGRQGGGVGRESWGRKAYTTHRGVRVSGFFLATPCGCFNA